MNCFLVTCNGQKFCQRPQVKHLGAVLSGPVEFIRRHLPPNISLVSYAQPQDAASWRLLRTGQLMPLWRSLMRRFAQLLLLLVFCQFSFAEDVLPTVDGERFTKKFIGNPPYGDKLLEFIRDSESFDNWTKLVGYRYQQLPGLENDPIKYASAMGQIVKLENPRANFQILKNEQSNEAIIDFLTWPKDQKYVELNVFRLWKSKDGKAVVSLQMAYRFEAMKPAQTQESVNEFNRKVKDFRERRHSWIKQAAESDAKVIEGALLVQ